MASQFLGKVNYLFTVRSKLTSSSIISCAGFCIFETQPKVDQTIKQKYECGPYPEYRFGVQMVPKFNGDLLVRIHVLWNFHKDPISFSRDTSKILEKCPILQCWRIIQKDSWTQIQMWRRNCFWVVHPTIRPLISISRDKIALYLVEEFSIKIKQIFNMWVATAEKGL